MRCHIKPSSKFSSIFRQRQNLPLVHAAAAKKAVKKPIKRNVIEGKTFQALAVSEIVMPVGNQVLDLDLLPEQIRSLQRWFLAKRQAKETPFLVFLTRTPNSERQGGGRKKQFGSVGVLVRVTKIFKAPESDKHTLEYVGVDRCTWKFLRPSQVGIDSVSLQKAFSSVKQLSPETIPSLERLRNKIVTLAKELSEKDAEFKPLYRSLQMTPEEDYLEFQKRLFWHAEILQCSTAEHHDLLNHQAMLGVYRDFFNLLERRAKSVGEASIVQVSDFELEQWLRQAGVPPSGLEALRWDIKSRGDDSASYHRLLSALKFPWGKVIPWIIDLEETRSQLEKEYLGRPDEKRWLMGFLEHLQIVGQGRASKPTCFVGPPGVGKTTLVEFLAKHLGIPIASLPFGGVMTSEEMSGTSAVYYGARPSILTQTLRRLGCINPVIIFEEIDQGNAGGGTDPYPALLHLMDPKRNHAFRDLYLGFDIDYSHVTFMATANHFEKLPLALQERMRRVDFSPYTTLNKMFIIEKDVVPSILRARKKAPGSVVIPREVLKDIIHRRTHEGGVRTLSDHVERLVIFALQRAPGANSRHPKVVSLEESRQDLGDYLLKPCVRVEDLLGRAVGVGVDDVGGSVDAIEIAISSKSAQHTEAWHVDTGLQGRDMREVNRTVRAALAKHIATISGELFTSEFDREKVGLWREMLENHAILIHMPPPGEETSGPSAGIATALAILRELTGKQLLHRLVTTGSLGVDLDILPIGGERLKLQAAREAGAKHMLFPEKNRDNALLGLQQMVNESQWADDGLEILMCPNDLPLRESSVVMVKKKSSNETILTVHFAKTFSDVLTVAFPPVV